MAKAFFARFLTKTGSKIPIYKNILDVYKKIDYTVPMARDTNILKASFRGRLGETYGDVSRGTAKIKAIPFSRSPAKESVKQQCRAFECLNRLASGIARNFFKYLNLSDKKMLRHNAVAQWLKAGISDAEFSFEKIGTVIGVDGSTQIGSCVVNRENGDFTIDAVITSGIIPDGVENAFWVALVDDMGKVIYEVVPKSQGFAYTGVAKLSADRKYFCVAFQSHKNPYTKKWHTDGYAFAECNYQNG